MNPREDAVEASFLKRERADLTLTPPRLCGENEGGSGRGADSASLGDAILFGWRGLSGAWGEGSRRCLT